MNPPYSRVELCGGPLDGVRVCLPTAIKEYQKMMLDGKYHAYVIHKLRGDHKLFKYIGIHTHPTKLPTIQTR